MKNVHKTFLWRYNGVALVLFLLLSFLFSFLLADGARAASKASTISVDVTNPDLLEITPNTFGSTTASVAVTTDSPKGYKLIMQTIGETADMTLVDGGEGVIPTITSSLMEGGYGYSVDGINFKPAPSVSGEGDTVAEVDAVIGEATNAHEITFGVKVDSSILAGVYEKTFVFVAVANLPDWCDPSEICYHANDGTEAVIEQNISAEDTSVTLIPSNLSREGYGFAGWNTRADGTETNYGPNETITVGDLSESGLNLYARWIESSGTLQEWGGCDNLSVGDVIALTDARDGNTYAVAKLADGACWMIENLRLDLSNPDLVINAENTHNPTAEFIEAVNQHPSSSTNFCTSNNSNCIDQVAYNTDDFLQLYGVYYNWYTATAGNGRYELANPNIEVEGDICPAGWALPSGYTNDGDYAILDKGLGGTGNNVVSTKMSNEWRKYPNNFVFSGQTVAGSISNRGETGNYHGSTPSSQSNFYNFWLQQNRASTNNNGALKNRGQTVRCRMQKYYKVHFDQNSSAVASGTMYDQKVPLGHTITLRQNAFVIDDQDGASYRFIGWNTEPDGSGTHFGDKAKIVDLGENGETVTLYAEWDVTVTVNVTVNFTDEAITRVKFENDTYGDKVATAENNTLTLVGGQTYTVSASIDPNYDFTGWEASEHVTLGSTTVSPTSFVATADSTLSVLVVYRETTLYLQSLTASDCSTMPKIAYDVRDGEAYHFARLNDGNCWLLDNLRLGLTELKEELSSENTNMPEGASLTLNNPAALFDYTVPEIDTSRSDREVTNYGAGSGKPGVYYNYCATSAGTVCSDNSPESAEYDICPSGWRLPTGGKNGEYAALLTAYNDSVTRFNADLSITLAGWYDANAVSYKDLNKSVVLWTSTPSNKINKTYIIQVNAASINTTGYLENNGFSIRCMMK